MDITPSSERFSQRERLVGAVQSPLGFFALALLVVEGALAAVIAAFSEPDRIWLTWGMMGIILLTICLVAALAWLKPGGLERSSAKVANRSYLPKNISQEEIRIEKLSSRMEFYERIGGLVQSAESIVWDTTWGVGGGARTEAEHAAYTNYRRTISLELKRKPALEYRELFSGDSSLIVDTLMNAMLQKSRHSRNWNIRVVPGIESIPMLDILVFDQSDVLLSMVYSDSKWNFIHIKNTEFCALMAEHLKEVWRIGRELYVKDGGVFYRNGQGREVEVVGSDSHNRETQGA